MVTLFLEKVMNPHETKALEVTLKVYFGVFYVIDSSITINTILF